MKPFELHRQVLICTCAAVVCGGAVFAQSAPPAAPAPGAVQAGQAPAPWASM